jgi:hypothetical protein
LHGVVLILVVVGAVPWGLAGIARFDLVAALLGGSASGGITPMHASRILVRLAQNRAGNRAEDRFLVGNLFSL